MGGKPGIDRRRRNDRRHAPHARAPPRRGRLDVSRARAGRALRNGGRVDKGDGRLDGPDRGASGLFRPDRLLPRILQQVRPSAFAGPRRRSRESGRRPIFASASRRKTRIAPATPENIAAAAASLRAGGLVAMPTETVYGLAGLATSDAAVAAIYAAKGRPAFNPLIAHFADAELAAREAVFNATAQKRSRAAFWPGALTIVAPVSANCRVSLLARAGLDTLALRVPAHPVARALIEAAGAPLVAPSANRSGGVSATRAEHVAADLQGEVDWILDAGPSPLGLESTIVACTRRNRSVAAARRDFPRGAGGRAGFARPRAADDRCRRADRARRPRLALRAARKTAPRSQGTLREGEAALDFGGAFAGSAAARLDLSPDRRSDGGGGQSLRASARARCDRRGGKSPSRRSRSAISGVAVNDRLRRAAAPRPATISRGAKKQEAPVLSER